MACVATAEEAIIHSKLARRMPPKRPRVRERRQISFCHSTRAEREPNFSNSYQLPTCVCVCMGVQCRLVKPGALFSQNAGNKPPLRFDISPHLDCIAIISQGCCLGAKDGKFLALGGLPAHSYKEGCSIAAMARGDDDDGRLLTLMLCMCVVYTMHARQSVSQPMGRSPARQFG